MAADKSKNAVTPLLERILEVAPDESPAALFAHRHLAEYRIEDHPWRALLHLRSLVRAGRADDAVHALAGLAHALLGNYLAAVAAYRRAVALEPKNPWYRHNLGHLLDVALDRPGDALRHLDAAAATAKGDAEITASLAHCLARLGQRGRAEALAVEAAAAAPGSADHEELLGWIRAGAVAPEAPALARDATAHDAAARDAPVRATPARATPARAATPRAATARAVTARDAAAREAAARATPARDATARDATAGKATAGDASPSPDEVTRILLSEMHEGGFSPAQIDRALRLYASYRSGTGGPSRRASAAKPRVVAAALEYATARLEQVRGVTRASVARRYGVTPRAVSDRLGDLEGALAMTIP